MPRLASDPAERELAMPVPVLPSPLYKWASVKPSLRMIMDPLNASRPRWKRSTKSQRGPRSPARRPAKASVINMEKPPTPGRQLQPLCLVPRQQRARQPRQLLVVRVPTIAVRLAAARVLALVLSLEIPAQVLLPALQPSPAVPWPVEQELDSAPSPLCKSQKSGTHLQCRRKMLRTT